METERNRKGCRRLRCKRKKQEANEASCLLRRLLPRANYSSLVAIVVAEVAAIVEVATAVEVAVAADIDLAAVEVAAIIEVPSVEAIGRCGRNHDRAVVRGAIVRGGADANPDGPLSLSFRRGDHYDRCCEKANCEHLCNHRLYVCARHDFLLVTFASLTACIEVNPNSLVAVARNLFYELGWQLRRNRYAVSNMAEKS
jgi:hypothetical protein